MQKSCRLCHLQANPADLGGFLSLSGFSFRSLGRGVITNRFPARIYGNSNGDWKSVDRLGGYIGGKKSGSPQDDGLCSAGMARNIF
jgi:hypothetical protein